MREPTVGHCEKVQPDVAGEAHKATLVFGIDGSAKMKGLFGCRP